MTGRWTFRATVTRVVDGDTFDAVLDLGFRISTKARFRLGNIDTPESFRPRNQAEREHGIAATTRAKELLEGRTVQVVSEKSGKYGRWIAYVKLPNGEDYGDVMRREGFEKKESY